MLEEVKKQIRKIELKIADIKKEIKIRSDHLSHIRQQIKLEVERIDHLKGERDQLNTLVREKKKKLPDTEKIKPVERAEQLTKQIEKLEMQLQTRVLKPIDERNLVKRISTLAEERRSIINSPGFDELKQEFLNYHQHLQEIQEIAKKASEKHSGVHESYLQIKKLNEEYKRTKFELKVEQELLKDLRQVLKSKRQDLDTINSIEDIISRFGEKENISVQQLLKNKVKISMEDFYEIQREINKRENQGAHQRKN